MQITKLPYGLVLVTKYMCLAFFFVLSCFVFFFFAAYDIHIFKLHSNNISEMYIFHFLRGLLFIY